MKVTAAFLLVAGLVCLAHGAEDCPGSPVSGKCSAAAALSITATNGTCKGRASADCKVWTESEQVYRESVVTWLSQDSEELCTESSVNATAEAIATAVAKVWSNAFVELDCPGGYACGWSLANAGGYAASTAESLSLAVADAATSDAVSDTTAESFCYADVRAIGASFAEVAATAQADTCATFGEQADYENSFAQSIQSTIATTLARATVSICTTVDETADQTLKDVEASSLCEGEADVTREDGKIIALGDACAGTQEINLCRGKAAKICCKGRKSKPICQFTSKQKRKCKECKAPWIKQQSPGKSVIYSTSDRSQCLCDTQA